MTLRKGILVLLPMLETEFNSMTDAISYIEEKDSHHLLMYSLLRIL